MFKDIDIWDYFKDIGNDRAICTICLRSYSTFSAVNNLKNHILMQHPERIGLVKKVPKHHSVLVSKDLWKYYEKQKGTDKVAKCKLCDNKISYRTTTYNLKAHLSRTHTDVFQRILENIAAEAENGDAEYLETSNNEDSESGDQVTSDVWNYFEQETGGRVRCVVCRTSKPNNVEDLKNHLEEHHPKLLREESQMTIETADSDAGSMKDEFPSYTEVIYLEEGSKKAPKVVYKRDIGHKRQSEPISRTQKIIKKRRDSTPPPELPVAVEKQESSELDTFLKYIKCLLSRLPDDACAKLQMDIVNLIMNVKLNRNEANLERSNVQIVTNFEHEEVDRTRREAEAVSNSIIIDNMEHRYSTVEVNTSDKIHDN